MFLKAQGVHEPVCCARLGPAHTPPRYEQKDGAGRRPTVQASIEQEEEERTRRDNKLAIEIARQLQGIILCPYFTQMFATCCYIQ